MQATREALRLTRPEAAKLLGVDLRTLDAQVTLGHLVPSRPTGTGPGRRIYFDPDELRVFAKGGPEAAKRYRAKRDAD